MKEQALDEALTRALQAGFQLSRDQEDDLWSRFCARRAQETAVWAAFAAALAAFGAGLRPALRSSAYPGPFARGIA